MMRKHQELLSEEQTEQDIVSAFEHGKRKSVPNVKAEIERTTRIFKASGKKVKRINIRLSELDYPRNGS